MFELTDDHLRQAQFAPSTPQTPLYVFMTPEITSGKLFTLPNGELPHGVRSPERIIKNANHILQLSEIEFVAERGKWAHDDHSRPYGQAFLAQPAHKLPLLQYIDLTGPRRWDMRTAYPQPTTRPLLELHDHSSLLARVQSSNYRRDQLNQRSGEENQLPLRTAEEELLRSFGRFLLQQSRGNSSGLLYT